MQKPVLEVHDIHKYFPGVHALKGVDLTLFSGEVHALVGENGAGKSTLIKILSGVYQHDGGTYFIEGNPANIYHPSDAIKKGISVIYQELNSAYNLSVAENIFFGRLPQKHGRVLWKKLYAETQELLDEIGLDIRPSMKVQYLSIAEQQLVEIAKSISLNAKVIIMDEPTSALSPTEIQSLFTVIRKLKKQNVGIIYISHKIEEIFTIADRITVFRDGTEMGTANTNEVHNEDLINMMVGRRLEDVFPAKDRTSGKIILSVHNLSSDKIHDLSFYTCEGEIVGFSGLMGAGRTEMTKALFGIDKRLSGQILISNKLLPPNNPIAARRMGIGLVSENRKDFGIFPNYSVEKNISIDSLDQVSLGPIVKVSKEKASTNAIVKTLSIKTPKLTQLITKLSGGNQQKVMLARWLIKKNLKLLIIDEPTRGIDVGAKAEIYELMHQLAQNGLSILMVSSELPEILGMCDRIYVMKEGRITAEFKGKDADEKRLLSKAIC